MNIEHAEIFATLSNQTRLRCLNLAAVSDEVCVCEAVDALRVAQPSVSKAFRALKVAGLVEDRRDANWTYYRLSEDMPDWVETIVVSLLEELSGVKAFTADEDRLQKVRIRAQAVC